MFKEQNTRSTIHPMLFVAAVATWFVAPAAHATLDLTLTQNTYTSCLNDAANPSAQVTVTFDQQTLAGPTADLSAVYGALAAAPSAQGLTVSSNAAGSSALQQAQACIDATVASVGAARLHQVRPDLRHSTHILAHNQRTFNAFELHVEHGIITMLPDGVQDPDCPELIHLALRPLANGDLATSAMIVVDTAIFRKKEITRCEWEGDDCRTAPNKKKCRPTKYLPSDTEAFCTCAHFGDETGCATLGSTEIETVEFAAGLSLF